MNIESEAQMEASGQEIRNEDNNEIIVPASSAAGEKEPRLKTFHPSPNISWTSKHFYMSKS